MKSQELVIYITHGMAEHIGRYKWFIQKLNQDNFHVIAYDHRGHGEQIKKGKLQGHFANKKWLGKSSK